MIFEDIAQEAVGLCRQSLVSASEAIKLHRNALDAQLFLIRHLLILKDLVHKLDLVQKEAQKAVEPPGVTGTTILAYLIAVKFNSQVRCVGKYAEPNDIFIPRRIV